MNNKRSFIALLLIMLLTMGSIVGCGNNEEVDSSGVALQDGTYTGEARGHNADIEVEVEVKDGKIDAINVLNHEETEVLSDNVFGSLKDLIVENNSINVDTISGATVSSLGFRSAVKNALEKAGADDKYFEQGKKLSIEYGDIEDEKHYEAIVVGGGGAGLITAIEAKSQGVDVAIIEKQPFFGGNTLVSGGEFNAANSWVQEKLGIEDSVEQHIEDTLAGGDYQAQEALVTKMAENITENGEWLRDFVGVEFIEDYLMHFGGHAVPRAIYPIGGSGIELIQKLQAKVLEMEIPIYFEMAGQELLTDENQNVIGITAEDKEGNSINFYGEKGVVLATGGFGSNIDMIKEYNTVIDERYKSTNQKSSTGDGITMAKDVGADVTDMEFVQTYPASNPNTGHLSYVADTRFDGAILVNKEGKRFVEELERRDVISEAILDQTEEVGYLLWDETIRENSNMDSYLTEFARLEEDGLIVKAETIDEAAEFFEIEVETLKETIERFNGFAANGVDEDFNLRGNLIALEQAPYYIQKVSPAVHHTMGGLRINENTQVLNTDGQVINGLFAAGEVTGGIHGKNRLGGNAIADLIVFGRIAGENLAK